MQIELIQDIIKYSTCSQSSQEQYEQHPYSDQCCEACDKTVIGIQVSQPALFALQDW